MGLGAWGAMTGKGNRGTHTRTPINWRLGWTIFLDPLDELELLRDPLASREEVLAESSRHHESFA